MSSLRKSVVLAVQKNQNHFLSVRCYDGRCEYCYCRGSLISLVRLAMSIAVLLRAVVMFVFVFVAFVFVAVVLVVVVGVRFGVLLVH